LETGKTQEKNTNSRPSNNFQQTTTPSLQPKQKNTSKPHSEEDSEPNSVPPWGSFVGDILLFSGYTLGAPTPCGKFFISNKGLLYRSYQHMNELRAQETSKRFDFKASTES